MTEASVAAVTRSLDIEYGKWMTPLEAGRHIPGSKDRKSVIDLCATGQLEHVVKYTKAGDPRYYISENAIRAYIRHNTVKPSRAA